MEIKTSEEICKDINKRVHNRLVEWVAVDDLIKWINGFTDIEAFNEWQIRKATLIDILTLKEENKGE